jgi:hypothetical protein
VFEAKKKRKKKIQKKRTEAFGAEKLRNWGETEGHIKSASILRLRRELCSFFLSFFL